ncbi:hypothetical protein PTE30175_04474 [Pandoraea terrae]|uniref:Uncharacterized protein n=1 Tax=Pandoraea terrae TaxID=1537710 RepID=A0A5E4YJK5_9BURK|nr:hypothetical protein PTE30175_04474 [Pandoraea terrae]
MPIMLGEIACSTQQDRPIPKILNEADLAPNVAVGCDILSVFAWQCSQ